MDNRLVRAATDSPFDVQSTPTPLRGCCARLRPNYLSKRNPGNIHATIVICSSGNLGRTFVRRGLPIKKSGARIRSVAADRQRIVEQKRAMNRQRIVYPKA